MYTNELLARRITNQGLGPAKFAGPLDAVVALGALQAQDFAGATWAVAQRTVDPNAADFVDAFNRGEIVRTHVLRPTWHFVAASDLGWMLDLTGSRLERAVSSYYRKFGLDDKTLAGADATIEEALTGGHELTRPELADALARTGIDVGDPVRLTHIALHAEATGLICSGSIRGRLQTWALVSERIPQTTMQHPANAAAELARRYFRSHGPATVRDFSWWSGMTLRNCSTAIDALGPELEPNEMADATYWSSSVSDARARAPDSVQLLPNYDEYLVAYSTRDALFASRHNEQLDSRRNPLFQNVLVTEGRVIGTWKRVVRGNRVTADINLFEPASVGIARSLERAIERYSNWANVAPSQSS